MKNALWHFCIYSTFLVYNTGNCLQCYKCTESFRRGCYYGNVESLDKMNCAKDDVCITYQYERNCLQCYKCTESFRRGCYYGNVESLDKMNCAKDDVCITYQYEITDKSSSNSYITTARGCGSNDTCPIIMDTITTKKEIQRGVLCHVCLEDLCNTSGKDKYSSHILIVLLSYFTKFIQNL